MTALLDRPSTETRRLAERERVKSKLAEFQVKRECAKSLRRQLNAIDRQIEAAADEHKEATRPVQARLKEIEAEMKARILKREPIADLEDERLGLLSQITAANEKLETAKATLKKCKSPIGRQLKEVEEGSTDRIPLERKLTEELGNPELLMQKFAADQAVRWLQARCEAAREEIAKYRGLLGVTENRHASGKRHFFGMQEERPTNLSDDAIESYRRRLARWEYEYEAASTAHAGAVQEVSRLQQELFDE